MAPDSVEDLILVGPHLSPQEMIDKVAHTRRHHVRQPHAWPFCPHSARRTSSPSRAAHPVSKRITTVAHDVVSESEAVFSALTKIYQERSPDRETEEMRFALGVLESYRHAYLDLVERLSVAAQEDAFDAKHQDHQDLARVQVMELIALLFQRVQDGAFDAWPQECNALRHRIHAFCGAHLTAYQQALRRVMPRPIPVALVTDR